MERTRRAACVAADGSTLDVTPFVTWAHEGLESASPGVDLTPEEVERLRALGYLK